VFSSPTLNGVVKGMGPFEAVYDPDASPPALVNGTMGPPPLLSARCTWTATLQ
jgi:hypothetical protein